MERNSAQGQWNEIWWKAAFLSNLCNCLRKKWYMLWLTGIFFLFYFNFISDRFEDCSSREAITDSSFNLKWKSTISIWYLCYSISGNFLFKRFYLKYCSNRASSCMFMYNHAPWYSFNALFLVLCLFCLLFFQVGGFKASQIPAYIALVGVLSVFAQVSLLVSLVDYSLCLWCDGLYLCLPSVFLLVLIVYLVNFFVVLHMIIFLFLLYLLCIFNLYLRVVHEYFILVF